MRGFARLLLQLIRQRQRNTALCENMYDLGIHNNALITKLIVIIDQPDNSCNPDAPMQMLCSFFQWTCQGFMRIQTPCKDNSV